MRRRWLSDALNTPVSTRPSPIESGGESLVFVLGQLLDEKRIDGPQSGSRVELILCQVTREQIGAGGTAVLTLGGVTHGDEATSPLSQ